MQNTIRRTTVQFSFVLLALVLASCGGSKGSKDSGDGASREEPTSMLVLAATGGTVESSAGNLVIEIPAGALAADTEITIAPTEASDLGDEFSDRGEVDIVYSYELGPEGTVFIEPIKVMFSDNQKIDRSDDGIRFKGLFALTTSDGVNPEGLKNIVHVANIDDDKATIFGELDHLSPLLFVFVPAYDGLFKAEPVPDELDVGGTFIPMSTYESNDINVGGEFPTYISSYNVITTGISFDAENPLVVADEFAPEESSEVLSEGTDQQTSRNSITREAEYVCVSPGEGKFISELEVSLKDRRSVELSESRFELFFLPFEGQGFLAPVTYRLEKKVVCRSTSSDDVLGTSTDPSNDCTDGSNPRDCPNAHLDMHGGECRRTPEGHVQCDVEVAGDFPFSYSTPTRLRHSILDELGLITSRQLFFPVGVNPMDVDCTDGNGSAVDGEGCFTNGNVFTSIFDLGEANPSPTRVIAVTTELEPGMDAVEDIMIIDLNDGSAGPP